MNKYIKISLFGFLTWLVPFVAGFFFYSQNGELLVDALFFKSIMVVIGSLTGAFLLILYFKNVKKNYLTEGLILGTAWLLINIVLDLLVLVPMSEIGLGDYFMQIGFGYLAILVMCLLSGYLLEQNKAR